MAKVCKVTKKHRMTGNNVSHAHNKTKRCFEPNIHRRRLWVPGQKRYITLKISAQGLRTIDKLGIEVVLEKIKNKEIN